MKKGWEIKKLGDVLKVQNGYAFNSKLFTTKIGIPLIRIRDIKKGNGTETNFNGHYDKKYEVKRGDFLIGMDGEFGCYEWKGETALLNQRVCRLQDFSNNISPRFLFYGINKYLKAIENDTSFITVKHISSKQIEAIEIPLAPLAEQKRIVAILDKAFAAIDKAKANAEQNLKNAKELFESYLNIIDAPKVELGSLVEITTGKLNSNAAIKNGKYPFFTCSREVFSIDKYAFDIEAILLAGNNASGDFNVKHYKGKFNAYQRTYVITVNNNNRILYRFLYYQTLKSLKNFKEKAVGANTRFLKLGMIKEMPVALPSIENQKTIIDKLDKLKSYSLKIETIYKAKIDYLEELKKSILQKAFNGELDISKDIIL